MGERRPYKAKVTGSIPVPATMPNFDLAILADPTLLFLKACAYPKMTKPLLLMLVQFKPFDLSKNKGVEKS